MSLSNIRPRSSRVVKGPWPTKDLDPVVVMVVDHSEACPELREVLQQSGYRVIDTDNGRDAAIHARQIQADLLVVDMDVPLLYQLVAARQIIKQAQVAQLPVVIVTHEEIEPGPILEVGINRDEYVTRLSSYQELKPLLDYLFPVLPATPYAKASEIASSQSVRDHSHDTLAPSLPKLHLHRDA